MIYEMRVYSCLPGRLPDLLKRFNDTTLGFWAKYGIKQVGFWTTLVGPNNHDLVYMLQWESLADRETKWNAFAADQDWIKARTETEKNGPIVANIANSFLSPTAFSAIK